MATKAITLRKAIEHAIAVEQRGASYYQRMARTFADHEAVAGIFSKLAQDEAEHEAEFSNLLSQVPADEGAAQGEALQMVHAAGLSGQIDADNLEKRDDIKSPEDALLKALAFERSTLFYYRSLKDALGDSPQLQALIDAEKHHVLALMKVIMTEAEFRGLADRW